jgi:hypothetical protein
VAESENTTPHSPKNSRRLRAVEETFASPIVWTALSLRGSRKNWVLKTIENRVLEKNRKEYSMIEISKFRVAIIQGLGKNPSRT